MLWDLQGSLWTRGDRNITRQTNTPPSSVELGNQGSGQPPSRGKWRTILIPLWFLELFKNDENRPSCAFPPIASLQPLLKVKAKKLRNDYKLNWMRYQLLFGSGSLKPEGHALVGELGTSTDIMFWGVGSLRRRSIYEINNRCEHVQLLRTRNHRELHIFKSWEILPLLGPAISHFKYFTNPVLFSPPPERCCQDQLHNLRGGKGQG